MNSLTSNIFEPLESRRLMCTLGHDPQANAPLPLTGRAEAEAHAATHGSAAVTTRSTLVVPAYNSRPNSNVKLFLDFDGWSRPSGDVDPAYDQDGDRSTFNDAEIATIHEVWARLSEIYSPFNVNVTTVDPGHRTPGQVMVVLIGGPGWTPGLWGLGFVNGFTYGDNTCFVFSDHFATNARVIAEVGAHEAGHGFGLHHQAVWNGGTLLSEYNPGDGEKAPFMGWSHSSQRGLWWNGPTQQGPNVIQDDMESIARPYNGFGYAPDLPGGTTILNAIRLVSSPSVAFNGCIEKRYDSEFFSYDAPAAGSYTFSVQGARHNGVRIGMLDADLVVFNSAGTVISSASTGLDESITLNLKPGRYFVQVRGHQDYGDVGRYTLNVSTDPALFFALAQPLPTTGGSQSAVFSDQKIAPPSGHDELAMLLE